MCGLQGEPGSNSCKGPVYDADEAIKDFTKKFYEKTGNRWEDRDNFRAVSGKYTLLEMGDESAEEESTTVN